MASLNKAMLIGNLGKNCECRKVNDKYAISFSVAITEKWKDRIGEMRESTEWVNVSYFVQTDKFLSYLTKGQQVYVEGSIRTRDYTDANGVKKYITEVRADRVQLVGGKAPDVSRSPRQEKVIAEYNAPRTEEFTIDDLPF